MGAPKYVLSLTKSSSRFFKKKILEFLFSKMFVLYVYFYHSLPTNVRDSQRLLIKKRMEAQADVKEKKLKKSTSSLHNKTFTSTNFTNTRFKVNVNTKDKVLKQELV